MYCHSRCIHCGKDGFHRIVDSGMNRLVVLCKHCGLVFRIILK